MKSKVFVIAILTTLTALAQQDIQLLDGAILRNAKVIRKADSSIVFSHSTGIATVNASNLPEDILAEHLPDLIAKRDAPPADTGPVIYRLSELSETQKADVLNDLTSRYLIVPDIGLLEIFTANGNRSLNAAMLGYRYINDYVSQTLRGDEYFISGNSIKITYPGNDQLIDGSPIVGLAREDGNYEYTTVQGASRRIRAFRMVSSQRPQIDDFVDAMKTNQIFQAKMMVDVKCRKCSGQGFTMRATTVSAGTVACNSCAGKGSIERRQLEQRDPSKRYVGDGNTYKVTYTPCNSCGGTGRRAAQASQQVKVPCTACESKGIVKEQAICDVGW